MTIKPIELQFAYLSIFMKTIIKEYEKICISSNRIPLNLLKNYRNMLLSYNNLPDIINYFYTNFINKNDSDYYPWVWVLVFEDYDFVIKCISLMETDYQEAKILSWYFSGPCNKYPDKIRSIETYKRLNKYMLSYLAFPIIPDSEFKTVESIKKLLSISKHKSYIIKQILFDKYGLITGNGWLQKLLDLCIIYCSLDSISDSHWIYDSMKLENFYDELSNLQMDIAFEDYKIALLYDNDYGKKMQFVRQKLKDTYQIIKNDTQTALLETLEGIPIEIIDKILNYACRPFFLQ